MSLLSRISAAAIIVSSLVLAAVPGGAATKPSMSTMQTYTTPQAAASHCKGGHVVWVNTASGKVYKKGSAYYGKTKTGGYACESGSASSGKMGKSHK
ncbi:MAG: hypothetical protein KGM44_09790 [bacterium]|nr:hypothetical protein [bacterium]